jgi:hypothetical protein
MAFVRSHARPQFISVVPVVFAEFTRNFHPSLLRTICGGIIGNKARQAIELLPD